MPLNGLLHVLSHRNQLLLFPIGCLICRIIWVPRSTIKDTSAACCTPHSALPPGAAPCTDRMLRPWQECTMIDRKIEPQHDEGTRSGGTNLSKGVPAWSKCPLGSAPARLLCLPRARLAALGSSARPGKGRPTGRPATATSRLQSRRCPRR